jgi:hypothetical protein
MERLHRCLLDVGLVMTSSQRCRGAELPALALHILHHLPQVCIELRHILDDERESSCLALSLDANVEAGLCSMRQGMGGMWNGECQLVSATFDQTHDVMGILARRSITDYVEVCKEYGHVMPPICHG